MATSTMSYVSASEISITVNIQRGSSYEAYRLYCDGNFKKKINYNGNHDITGLSSGTSYLIQLKGENSAGTEAVVLVTLNLKTTGTSSGGGTTPDPDPDPGGGTTVTQNWQLYDNYTITETTVAGFIYNLSSSAFYLNTVTLRNTMGIAIATVKVNVLVAAGNYCPFSISNLSLTPALYYIYVNNDYYAGSVVLSNSSSSTKPKTFSWQTSVILQGQPLKITASDWTLLQNKITEVYTYIKSAIKPTWTTVIKGTTPISAEIYNEVADMINGLWYGAYDHYVDYATQKQTKLTAEIFNNLSTELNNYIAYLPEYL